MSSMHEIVQNRKTNTKGLKKKRKKKRNNGGAGKHREPSFFEEGVGV